MAQVDVATAFLQSTPFGPDEAPRYLMVKDPVTQQLSYFATSGSMESCTVLPVLLSAGRTYCTRGFENWTQRRSTGFKFQGSFKAKTRSRFFGMLSKNW